MSPATKAAWRRREREEAARGPFTEEEDAEIINATGCGVDLRFIRIEGRSFGEIIDRRLELVDAGRVSFPRPI